MHVFKDRKTEFELLPEQDFSFEVIEAGKSLCNSGKVSGCERIDLKLLFDGRANVLESLTLPYDENGEAIIQDEKLFEFLCARLDTFLATTGLVTKVGDAVNTHDTSIYKGLRGWARLKREPGTKDPKKIFNKVNWYITNREKLARVEQPTTANAEADGEEYF